MFRLLSVLALLLPTLAFAQAPTPSLGFKVSLGGMNIGEFSTLVMPTHSISLQGDDVYIAAKAAAGDKRPITLSGGLINSVMLKMIMPRVGEQMTVEIAVITKNTKPGRRCTIKMDYAILKKWKADSMTVTAKALAGFVCTPPMP